MNNFIKIAQLLINKGATLHILDEIGQTPLDIACEWGHTDIEELLRYHLNK
jgi:ankyrin repeat protein